MPFAPTHARYRPDMGLELREGEGPWMGSDTKIVLLEAGVVALSDPSGEFDEKVNVPAGVLGHDPATITGTTNPIALGLARKRSRGEFLPATDGGWLEIVLPEH